jgi:foldase protein PrsA
MKKLQTLKKKLLFLIKKYKSKLVIGIVLIFVITGLFLAKGLFVVAIVNGKPISRLSVIKELEKQGGKQVLKGVIDQKIIETELDKQKITVTKEEVDEEIKKIEEQVSKQGTTLKDALAQQNMTEEKLRSEIAIQKRIEKLLIDKIAVSESEIDTYINDSKATLPKDTKPEDFRKQISLQLQQQKLQTEAQKWVSELTTNAKIKYFVNY